VPQPAVGGAHPERADTYNPIEPAALLTRLQTLGFLKITIMVDRVLKFVASKDVARKDLAA